MIEDIGNNGLIEIPIVSGEIVKEVVEYVNRHSATDAYTYEELVQWDLDLIDIKPERLLQLIIAGDYLDVAVRYL
jgi:Skp1 family, tetramerisation domain